VSAYSDRPAYAGVGEHGVYVAPDARGRGIGRRLLDALAAEAEDAGFHKLTSRVFTTNEASRAVHRAAGFYEVGIQPRHARLDGEWKDCVLVERLLGPARS
jgi:phosphinothricin acetyltransferase